MYKEALKIAYKAHDGQYRRDSYVPYIVHPIRVSNCFNDDFRKTIAVLHDVIEDTSITYDDLNQFSMNVIKILEMLTKRENENHFDYVDRVKQNEIAIEIKIADIVDNLSDTISIQPMTFLYRYNKSLKILINKL